MNSSLLALLFAVLIAIRTPIFLTLGGLALLMFWIEGEPLISLAQIVVDHLNSETLVAIPFFVIAAAFMTEGGVAKALIDCANAWIGRVRGGLAIVCVVATTIFAAICGSSVATAMAMGAILIPAMNRQGYDKRFSLGIVGASGTLGILIPPSLAFIVYAIIAEESVPRLFLAGVIPGFLQASMFIAIALFYAYKRGYPKGEPLSREQFIAINLYALPALSVPFIVLGGIYSGIVTVTEAAGLAALAAMLTSVVFYRECSIKDVIPVMARGIKSTAAIVFIILTAMAFGHWITGSGLPQKLVEFATESQMKPWMFLVFINILLLFLGMFLEVFAIMLIALPILLPILDSLGINLIHFAVVMTINMELALLTPPVGLNLFVLSSVSEEPMSEVVKGIVPFVIALFILLIIVTYIPQVSLWLPNLIYGS